jgi:arginyl-tRNA synthetase
MLTVGDVVEEVGADAVRFNLLSRGPESTIDFDLDLAVARTNDNPVYYVQYSHARICSILARRAESGFDVTTAAAGAPVTLLTHPSELALIRKLLDLEEQIDTGGREALAPQSDPLRRGTGQSIQRILS